MASKSNAELALPDGSFDWSSGVNSDKPTTLKSPLNPNGLDRNALSWLNNATVRGGSITPRAGFQPLLRLLASGRWQGGFMYEPDGANPYLVCSVDGNIYLALLTAPFTVTNLSAIFGVSNPPGVEKAFFAQAEMFLVIQAGDYITLPLFWDGTILRRSLGIFNISQATPGAPLPPTVYNLSLLSATQWPTISFLVPPVGSSVVVPLSAPYPGSVNDEVSSGWLGNFKVIGVSGNTFTIQTISSPLIGQYIGTSVSVNFTVTNTPPSTGGPFNEIPAAGPMYYHANRLWYALGRTVSAGDIAGGAAGTLAYSFRDAVIHVTENPLCVRGDGFTIPTNDGNIRALCEEINLNQSVGDGRLLIWARKVVYALTVPQSRTDWIAADVNNMPKIVVIQRHNGTVSERSLVSVNGDWYYQSFDPAIRSLITAIRYYEQPGNTPISQNELRALQLNDRSLMHFSGGIEFDNRMLQLVLPKLATDGVNVVHDAILPLDFDIVSNLAEKQPPAWEGANDGLQFVQLFAGDFGGLPRAFSVVISEVDGSLNVWEITNSSRTDNGDNRVLSSSEFPAFTWFTHGLEYKLKQLNGGECWIDQVSGTVDMDVYYRPDADPCWRFWFHTSFCAARNCEETIPVKACYPDETFRTGYKYPVVFPEPPAVCDSMGVRPTTIGYQHQVKIVLNGWCRIRGLILYALPKDKPQFQGVACDATVVPQGMARLPQGLRGGGISPTPPIPPTPPSPPSPPTPPIPPPPTPTVDVPVSLTIPVITGTAQVGQTLSGSDGTWSNTPTIFTYRWLANGVEIGGATVNTFLLTSAQLGAVITFEVTASNTGGSGTPATSLATDAVIAAPLTDSFDDMESYTVASDVNGLNGGTGWLGAYSDNFPGIGLGEVDDMESYTIAAALDGLNGGTAYHQFWGGPYVDR